MMFLLMRFLLGLIQAVHIENVLWNFLDSEFTCYIPVSLFGFMDTLSGEEEQTLKPDRLGVKFHGYVDNCKLVKP